MASNKEKRRNAPIVDIHGAFVRRTNLSGANLKRANLSQADASGASFEGADFEGARLVGTILRGADLTDARNLTAEQLADAILDENTRLPDYIDRAKLRQCRSQSEIPLKAGS